MADFRIRLNTEIDDSKARQQLNDLVNDYLKTSPYVSKYRYGEETEGRDGVVIVDLL